MNKTKVKIIIALIVVFVAAVLWSLYTQEGLYKVPVENNEIKEIEGSERKSVIEKVSELIILPLDQSPVLIELKDVETLKSRQTFYANAVDGDFLLVFPNSKKAIIYSEQRNILVNVGPIVIDENNGAEVIDLFQSATTSTTTEQ